MKILIASFILFLISPMNISNDYVKVELGKGLYYYGDSKTNDIYYLPSYQDTTQNYSVEYPHIVWPVITRVESFGFNKKFILASSKNNSQVNYWIIDKTQEINDIFSKEEGDRIAIQNVKKIDSLKFNKIKKTENIEVYSISYYHNLFESSIGPGKQ